MATKLRITGLQKRGELILTADSMGLSALASVIQLKRTYLGININQLAQRAGVSHKTISSLESRKTTSPHLRSVVKILDALNYQIRVEER